MIAGYANGVKCKHTHYQSKCREKFRNSCSEIFHCSDFLSFFLIIFPLTNEQVAEKVPNENAKMILFCGITLRHSKIKIINNTTQYNRLNSLKRLYSLFINGLFLWSTGANINTNNIERASQVVLKNVYVDRGSKSAIATNAI
jgi:hypothetical protein